MLRNCVLTLIINFAGSLLRAFLSWCLGPTTIILRLLAHSFISCLLIQCKLMRLGVRICRVDILRVLVVLKMLILIFIKLPRVNCQWRWTCIIVILVFVWVAIRIVWWFHFPIILIDQLPARPVLHSLFFFSVQAPTTVEIRLWGLLFWWWLYLSNLVNQRALIERLEDWGLLLHLWLASLKHCVLSLLVLASFLHSF